ncbi:hypothetical protein ABE547_14150 [Dorea sp. YH-dor226]|uniref:hypothetical protein n=1 Tax=Dorea sp. YH-dor226 TaxID=3151119 RepID=UPI0032420B52
MKTLDSLQDKALGMTATATTLATGAAAIPGDATTPVANKLADVAGYMVIVYVAIILEKYLLTLMGMVTFKFLIPVGLIAIVISILFLNDRWKQVINRMAIKFMIMGILLWVLVPVSAWTTNVINDTYASAYSVDILIREDAKKEKGQEESDKEDQAENEGVFDIVSDKLKDLTDAAKDKVDSSMEEFENALNKMIEGVAVMIVTTCVIPICVLLLFLWIVQVITGVKISPNVVKQKRLVKKGSHSNKDVEEVEEY